MWVSLLVVSSDTSGASPAVLRTQRHSDHAVNAKVPVIIFPLGDQILNDFFLFLSRFRLWNETWIPFHAKCVEKDTKAVTNEKQHIQNRMRLNGDYPRHCQQKDSSSRA